MISPPWRNCFRRREACRVESRGDARSTRARAPKLATIAGVAITRRYSGAAAGGSQAQGSVLEQSAWGYILELFRLMRPSLGFKSQAGFALGLQFRRSLRRAVWRSARLLRSEGVRRVVESKLLDTRRDSFPNRLDPLAR